MHEQRRRSRTTPPWHHCAGRGAPGDNVFVAANARLDLGGPNLRALYLESSASGFTSIVGWGGDLYFDGTHGIR